MCCVPFDNQVQHFLLIMQTELLQILSLHKFSLFLCSIRLFRQLTSTSSTNQGYHQELA